MKNNLSKRIQSQFNILGIYQIGGGIIGLGLVVWLSSGLRAITLLLVIILLVAIALYSYSIYCGILLLRKNIFGVRLSLVNQFLQLFSLSIFGFTFQYTSGAFFSVGFDLTNSFLFTFNLGISQWQLTINDNKELLIVNFNIVALFLILFIERLRKEIQKEQVKRRIASIGQ